ncbi:hypothetical protein [Dyella sp. 20L07]|uniref:hypothetical protein n=1 Tax=Dyella sp. 20L07 TaxID=3384240 RepID=UPI003D2D6538
MALSINTASTASPLASAYNVSAIAQQTAAGPVGADASVTISPSNATQTSARVDKYLQALGAPLQMSMDAQDIAKALVPSMQAVILERPDLANAAFDFVSDNGSLKVMASGMNDSDKAWLQDTLNGNQALVRSVQSFHDHAVGGYATWAEADGSPLSAEQSRAVSQQVDGFGGFMSLLHKLGSSAQSTLMKDGTYYATNGAKLNLGQNPGSAVGLLSFMQSADEAASGTVRFETSTGKSTTGALRMNIFGVGGSLMPQFLPSSRGDTLGVSRTA